MFIISDIFVTYRTSIYHIPVKRVRVIVTKSVLNDVVMGDNIVVTVCLSQKNHHP